MSSLGPVHCPKHGERRPTFVCQHLVYGSGLGFYTPDGTSESDDSEEQQAWCSECERIRQQEGGWNDVSEGFAKVTMICDICFDASRQRNITHPNSWLKITFAVMLGIGAALIVAAMYSS